MGERFNARLIKTADLPPDRPYVFACFPHGVTALSGWLAFGTEATGFGELFEGAGFFLYASTLCVFCVR